MCAFLCKLPVSNLAYNEGCFLRSLLEMGSACRWVGESKCAFLCKLFVSNFAYNEAILCLCGRYVHSMSYVFVYALLRVVVTAVAAAAAAVVAAAAVAIVAAAVGGRVKLVQLCRRLPPS